MSGFPNWFFHSTTHHGIGVSQATHLEPAQHRKRSSESQGMQQYLVRAVPSMNLQKPLFIRYAIVGVLVKCFGYLLLLTPGMWRTRDLEALWVPEFRGNDGLDGLLAYRSERGWSPAAFIHTSVLQRTDPLESDYRHSGQEAQGRECECPLIVACHDV